MTTNSQPPIYQERVIPGLSYFIAGLVIPMISTLISMPFLDEFLWIVPTVTYGTYIAVGLVLAPRIEVNADYLRVGKATIPRKFITTATEIPTAQRFSERGAKLNPAAYFRFQVGVNGLAKVEIRDPEDPTPYWLFATRHPDIIAGYLNRKD